jgi:hypothetical protein
MGKSSREKLEYAKDLLFKKIPYLKIQELLKEKFCDRGVSNSTLKKLSEELKGNNEYLFRIKNLEKELKLFKKLYFDLKKKQEDKNENIKD